MISISNNKDFSKKILPEEYFSDIIRISREDLKIPEINWSTKFHYIAKKLKLLLSQSEDMIVFLDIGQINLNSLNLATSLILAFPDVHWIFVDNFGSSNDTEANFYVWNIRKLHFLLDDPFVSFQKGAEEVELFKMEPAFFYLGYEPLFDPLGIRNQIRENLKRYDKNNRFQTLPVRREVAVAMDEEIPYALFNAYTAYKFGYRAWAIYTDTIAKEVLGNTNNQDIDFIFEDLYLNFPDRPSGVHYSILEERDKIFKKLKEINTRIFVTSGHSRTQKQKETKRRNNEYLRILKYANPEFKYKFVYKTYEGIYALWKKAGFYKNGKPKLSKAFSWPPSKRAVSQSYEEISESSGHSAPGNILTIAHFMVDRARRILNNAENVRDAITSAVLAMEAKELLMNKTPTTSFEALALQHEAEVLAETMFMGVEYNINTKDRFKEIERETKLLSKWYKRKQRKRVELNSRLSIAEKLARVFSNQNQFEEEQSALNEARKLSFKFWSMQKPYRKLIYPFLKYIEISLRSITAFVAIVLLWTLVFGFSYFGLAKIANRNEKCKFTLSEAISASTLYYFTMQTPQHWSNLIPAQCPYEKDSGRIDRKDPEKIDESKKKWNIFWSFFLAFQGLVSLVNLGLLISHIYLIVSRR